jgi:hypothetical protein
MMGCLKAFAKTTATKKFYDLERLKVNGLGTEVDLGFDESKVLSPAQIADLKAARPDLDADIDFHGTGTGEGGGEVAIPVSACGGLGKRTRGKGVELEST